MSGFLGSGKTTLLNRLLRRPEFAATAVIVNEFGEIGLDHFLIEQATDNVVLLESGCLCCTIVDSLHETLAQLHYRRMRAEIPSFQRVVVETTGLAEPGPILNAILGHPLVRDHFRLGRLVVTVDALHAPQAVHRHPEVARQIALADVLIVTKLDLVEDAAAVAALLDSLNPAAIRYDARDADALVRALEGERDEGLSEVRTASVRTYAHHHPAHAMGVSSHAFVLDQPPTWAGVAAWWRLVRDHFGDRLLRCKGLLEIADTGEIVFIQAVQRVFHTPERLPGWPGDDHRSRLVCITAGVDEGELRASLKALSLEAGANPSLRMQDLTTPGRLG
ncbi:MAG TPA: GTP-binding protein [Casimicrobiaceae bacterium]|nr:GTP-binding protein [Casimicrobiaceae bacterium]